MLKKQRKTHINYTIQSGYPMSGLVFNLLSAVYFYSISPIVSNIFLRDIYTNNNRVIWFGIFVFLMMLLEAFAFIKKVKAIQFYNKNTKFKIGGVFFFLWTFHLVIALFTLFLGLSALGYNVFQHIDNEDTHWSISLLTILITIKEIVLLIVLLDFDNKKRMRNKLQKPRKQNTWIADIILIIYSWVAYSIIWTAISKIGDTDMHKDNLPMYIGNLVIVCFLFLLFYLPIRIPFLIEETIQIKTSKDYLKIASSIAIAVIAAIASL